MNSLQKRVATQSQLDICAVKWASSREALLEKLAKLNRALQANKLGIYAARGAVVMGPSAGAIGGAALPTLLRINQALALQQDSLITGELLKEIGKQKCPPTPFTLESVDCVAVPALTIFFHREKTLFPDVKGPLKSRDHGTPLSRIYCKGYRNLRTELIVQGDPSLLREGFHDSYEK